METMHTSLVLTEGRKCHVPPTKGNETSRFKLLSEMWYSIAIFSRIMWSGKRIHILIKKTFWRLIFSSSAKEMANVEGWLEVHLHQNDYFTYLPRSLGRNSDFFFAFIVFSVWEGLIFADYNKPIHATCFPPPTFGFSVWDINLQWYF